VIVAARAGRRGAGARLAVVSVLALALAIIPEVGPAPAAPEPAILRARDWLVTQQQPDGGFEVAGFPGFETPDAALALAIAGQPGGTWDHRAARAAIGAVRTGGRSALHWAGDFAEGPITAGQAAKLILLVGGPVNANLRAFDPAGDGTRVDVVGIVEAGRRPDGSYGTFNATLFAVMAMRVARRPVPARTLALVRAAQQRSGGWSYTGRPDTGDPEIDTTGFAIQALVAAGAGPSDPSVAAGLRFLARQQGSSGAWRAFGQADPNSTAQAVLAITAAGYQAHRPCWRDHAAPRLSGRPYRSPTGWLRAQQQPDGRIASPADAWGINTFATSQSVAALARSWLPPRRAPRIPCP
jgi:hypothetical protein